LLEVAVVEVEDLEQATQQRKAEELPLKGLLEEQELTQLVVVLVEEEWVQLVKAFLMQITRAETVGLGLNIQFLDHQLSTRVVVVEELIIPQTMAQEDLEEEEEAVDFLETELRQLMELQIQAEVGVEEEHLVARCMRLEMADLELSS
jgi:hypothetical protein